LQRVRFRFGRGESLKYLGHLDVLRTLHRAFRRAKYPLLYRGKFNPQPRLDPGIPLPVGATSENDYGEVFLTRAEIDTFTEGINRQLPTALTIKEAALVSLQDPALMEQINSALYHVFWNNGNTCNQPREEVLRGSVKKLLDASNLTVYRKGKKKKKQKGPPPQREINIRPYIYSLEIKATPSGSKIEMLLQTGNRGGTSPLEVLHKIEEEAEGSVLSLAEGIHRVGLFWYDGKNIIPPQPFAGGNYSSL